MSKKEIKKNENVAEFLKAVKTMLEEKTAKAEGKLFEAIYKLELLVPLNVMENGQANFHTLTNAKGENFIPAFLSEDSNIGEFPKEILRTIGYTKLKYFVIDEPDLFAGIVINPFEENFIFDKKLIELVDSAMMGMSLQRSEYKGKVSIFKPDKLNLKMIDELNTIFQESKDVARAWLFNSLQEGENIPHITVLVDFIGSKIELFPKLADVMKKYLDNGQRFELIQKGESFDVSGLDGVLIFSRN